MIEDDEEFEDLILEGLAPETMDENSWKVIRQLARDYMNDGEANYCKCAVLAYFDFIEMATTRKSEMQ